MKHSQWGYLLAINWCSKLSTNDANPWSHTTQQTEISPQKVELILEARKAYWCPEDLPPSKTIDLHDTWCPHRWPNWAMWKRQTSTYVAPAFRLMPMLWGICFRGIAGFHSSPCHWNDPSEDDTRETMWNQGLGLIRIYQRCGSQQISINSCLIEYNIHLIHPLFLTWNFEAQPQLLPGSHDFLWCCVDVRRYPLPAPPIQSLFSGTKKGLLGQKKVT